MIYFFINALMIITINLGVIYYFKNKKSFYSFLIILFNMNIGFLFLNNNINGIYFVFSSIILILTYKFFLYNSKEEKEVILVKDGNIVFNKLIENYSLFKLLSYLRLHHIKIDDIAYLVKKGSSIVVIKNKNNYSFPISIIVDGKLQEENLLLIKKDEKWLKNELIKKHLLIDNIDYAYYKKNKIYFVKEN